MRGRQVAVVPSGGADVATVAGANRMQPTRVVARQDLDPVLGAHRPGAGMHGNVDTRVGHLWGRRRVR